MDEAAQDKVPAVVERFVKQLIITAKAVRLYPAASNIPKERAAALVAVLKTAQQRLPEVTIYFARDGLYYGDQRIYPGIEAYAEFAQEFYARNVDQARFHVGTTARELVDFLSLLTMSPDQLREQGGFEARMWDLNIASITVREIVARIVDAEGTDIAPEESDEPPPTPEDVDKALTDQAASRPGAHRALVRVVLDRGVMRDYLSGSEVARGVTPPDALVAGRVVALAHAIHSESPEDRVQLERGLAAVLLDLDPEQRRLVVGERLLPTARHDPAVATVLAQMSVPEVGEALTGSIPDRAQPDEFDASRSGLARALHNLEMLGVYDPDAVERQIAGSLRAKGASDEFVGSLLSEAMPASVSIPERATVPDPSVAGALEVVEMAATAARPNHRLEIAALQEEARTGIGDGDVLGTLVAVAAHERRPEAFGMAVSVVEEDVRLLIEGQHFTVAADAAEALVRARDDETRTPEQRARLNDVLAPLTDKRAVEEVAAAVRLYPVDSPEQAACRRLLKLMCGESLDSVLEVLADAPDMAARKTLVDALASVAGGFVPALSARIADPRWYLVRNVVTVLGQTRDPTALPALARAARFPEPRVRREAIRAIDAIPDPRGPDLLVAALSDADAGNVQLAARALGTRRAESAVPGLILVALGEGSGNREPGPRADAIDALGRIGSESAVPALETLTRFKGLRALGRRGELVPAAERALRAIRSGRRMPATDPLAPSYEEEPR